MKYGYKLMAEGFGPKELVEQAVRAEEAGFDFVEISDHYHPWIAEQGHAPFAWTVLGAIAARTRTLGLATGVTCPSFRYHPAIIAQSAATLAVLSDGRFTLGLGAGERLNEHIVGPWPGVRERHARLSEAIEIIRRLWEGGTQHYEGMFWDVDVDAARVWDLPEDPITIAVAASGPASVRIAAEHGDGMFAVQPRRELVDGYAAAGGTGPRYCEVPLAWAPSTGEAVRAAFAGARWSLPGWKTMSELPNTTHFAAASGSVRPEDMEQAFACGPDAATHLAGIRAFSDAGFDHLALQNAGPDQDGFFEFFATELRPRLQPVEAAAVGA